MVRNKLTHRRTTERKHLTFVEAKTLPDAIAKFCSDEHWTYGWKMKSPFIRLKAVKEIA
jgi:hypothetical protein